MGDLSGVGRLLVLAGAGLIVIGVVVLLADRIPFFGWLGRLPGDLVFRRGNTTIYVPIVTSIILSIILSIVLTFIFRRE